MRGYKAKVLRRIAQSLESDEPGYVVDEVKGETHHPVIMHTLTGPVVVMVSNTIHRKSRAVKLYRKIKHDIRRGGQ
jgi:hypothetical protein